MKYKFDPPGSQQMPTVVRMLKFFFLLKDIGICIRTVVLFIPIFVSFDVMSLIYHTYFLGQECIQADFPMSVGC